MIVNPDEVDVLEQGDGGHRMTLMTCYPIGTTLQRYVVVAEPQSNLVDFDYDQLMAELSLEQKLSLHSMAMKWKKKMSETQKELVIWEVKRLKDAMMQRTNISDNVKRVYMRNMDYVLYELVKG